MAQVRKHLLILALMLPACPQPSAAQKFYADDPLLREPPPMQVSKAKPRDINDYFDFFQSTFFEPGHEERKEHGPTPSRAVNTLGEVPDNSWFTNRIGSRPMSIEELVRGPGNSHPPDESKPWTVVSAKLTGVSPGLVIQDGAGRRYFLKFDPESNPEMASAADVIGSKFYYALGYNVPENYIVYFTRQRLALDAKSTFKDADGKKRQMTDRDLNHIMKKVPRDREGRYRALASLSVPGDVIGPHRYYGTRTDDPNDIVDHEDRRDQRGLYVFCAWLNHTDAKSINSLDSLVEENGVKFVKHYLIDFGDSMGSDSDEPKDVRRGNVYVIEKKPALAELATFGFYVPAWLRASYPHIPEIGHFEYETFDPRKWHANYPNPAFDMRTPGDEYWAAKKVMAFSDEAIRAIVGTGRYSDPRAAEWAVKCLIERRNRIGRAFFEEALPLDHFRVDGGKLAFDDLAAQYGFRAPRQYSVLWMAFDNATGDQTPIAGATGFEVPRSPANYLAAEIRGGDGSKKVTVYLRGHAVVGIERTW